MSYDQLRIGDAEREAALEALGEHFAAGRLTHEEYDERAQAVWTAKTRGDLAPMFADLPRPAAPPRPQQHRSGWRPPLLPLLVVLAGLIALSTVTHVPFFLIGLIAWVLFFRRGRRHHHRHRHHAEAAQIFR